MSTQTYGLGGRLPLQSPMTLDPKQRELYNEILSHVVPWADAAGFASKDREGRLIGPFNSTLYSPEMCGSFLALQKAESQHTSLSKRTREVVILTVGSMWKAPYELYAHTAVGTKAGFTAKQIEALIAGHGASGLSEDEVAAQAFTHQLVSQHAVDENTYAVVHNVFGDRGIVEMLILIGCYLSVCALLNAFAVPVPNAQPRPNPQEAR